MRGKKAKQRPSKPDSMYNNLLVQRLINYVMKDGRRTVAEKIVYGAMDELAKQLRNEAGDRQVSNLKYALMHNIGGIGNAIVCNILKKVGG